MNEPTNHHKNLASVKGNPRRQAAHLSVSLRRDTPSSTISTAAPYKQLRNNPTNESSDENEQGSNGNNVQKWFNRSNRNPKVDFSQSLQDEPPYFLPQESSNGSNYLFWTKQGLQGAQIEQTMRSKMMRSNTNASSTDEYRSVIDDLTIENKKLREENKRLKKSHTPHLAKDRLFEVTIHKLSAQKRRQLENTLREFAASLDESSSSDNDKIQPGATGKSYLNSKLEQKLSIGSSNSNSQAVDSAYNSGPASTPNLIPGPLEEKVSNVGNQNQTRQGNTKNIQNFLQSIPEGSLPKQPAAMTERQKKRLVVQRLEQLFTGKRAIDNGSHSQPLQQQEVSRSAARADHIAGDTFSTTEGVREAHMLPTPMEVDSAPGNLARIQPSSDTQNLTGSSNCSRTSLAEDAEAEQRPTRPLDLDPDRAQIPSENVEYLRHLGLSIPQLVSEDSSDAEQDAQGWIYLNLLINMAQLHIINVTPDFVRHAVQDVSEKFQISQDGDKLRWRGGSQGTRLSSDGGSGSAPNQSPYDSDAMDYGGGKRRKVDGGRFASIPVHIQSRQMPSGVSGPLGGFHYRPLFNHRSPSSEDSQSSVGSSSMNDYRAGYEGNIGTNSRSQRSWSGASPSLSGTKKRREDGTMVFYSNAHFCTDLSGDREISPPLHISGAGEDGFNDHTKGALGSKSGRIVPPISRTTSGSILPYRPFKAQSSADTDESDSKTPALLVYSFDDDMLLGGSGEDTILATPMQSFEACGLGGIQPADHFAVQVDTRRTNTGPREPTKLSKFSAPGIGMKRFHHRISKSSLDVFIEPDSQVNADTITKQLASLATLSPSLKPRSIPWAELPIKTEYLSERFTQLEPSRLPEAVGYYGASSSSDDSSEYDESAQDASHMLGHRLLHKSLTSITDSNTENLQAASNIGFDDQEEDEETEEEDEDEDEEDSDSSIDMLAHMRKTDPRAVALREAEFKMASLRDAHARL